MFFQVCGPSKKYSSFFSGTIIFEAVFFQVWVPFQKYSSFFSGTIIFKAVFFHVWGPSQKYSSFCLELCLSKVVDVALLALDFSSWEVSAPKKVGIFKNYWLQRIQSEERKKKTHKSRHQKNITPEKNYNPWKKLKFQKKRNYNYNAFFTKKCTYFFCCFFLFSI